VNLLSAPVTLRPGRRPASLASPMPGFADQDSAVATARALLERLRPVPARRGFLFGRSGAAR
jgi:hypothetical protein